MPSLLELTLIAILKGWVTPYLKPLDFKTKRTVYLHQGRDVSWVINLQRSLWNTATELSFTFNCGIYVPGIVSVYINRPEPEIVGLTDCCIWSQIGLLSSSNLDHWWTVCAEDDSLSVERDVGRDIQERLQRDGLPFLRMFTARDDVLRFLESPRPKKYRTVWPWGEVICRAYAAIMYSQSGRIEESLAILDAITEDNPKSPVRDVILNLRDRISKSGSTGTPP